MWIKTIQQDLKSSNLSLNEALDVAQNCPLWRLTSTFGAAHSQRCLPEKKKMEEIRRLYKQFFECYSFYV